MTESTMRFGPSEVRLTRHADGSATLRSPHALPAYPRAMTDLLERWAHEAPDRIFLAQRGRDRVWQKLGYARVRGLARNVAQALIDRGLSAERPIAILSGNSIAHAILGLGAMYAGVPYASVSTAYSLISSDFGKLRAILGLLTPGLVFADDGEKFARALTGVVPDGAEIVTETPLAGRATTAWQSLLDTPAGPAVDAAHGEVTPDTIAKILFTSGSTGTPKGVITTQRMLTSNQAMLAIAFPRLADSPPTLLDWLPWSHCFGANHNLGMALMNGGTFHIDDGKPLPGAVDETVRNLRDVAPTMYLNVPKGYELLLEPLRADAVARRNLFDRLQCLFYAGAVLPPHVAAAYERMAIETTGRPIPMVTSIGSTETAPSALTVTRKALAPGVVGIPNVGVELKLVPNQGKLEARLKGPLITPGYWRQPELTAKSFDADGYYLLGDALRFADAADPEKGLMFDGRIAEDFKLKTGTWVSVGPLRARFIAHFAPLARDVVIAGHDRDEVTGLVIPDLDACRALLGAPATASAAEVCGGDVLRARFAALLAAFNRDAGGSSYRFARLLLVDQSLSLDAGELTDKGSINQRQVLAHRAALVAELYAPQRSPRVIA